MTISQKTVSVNCDSVYKNKHYKLELKPIKSAETATKTYIFTVLKASKIIYNDTITSTTKEIRFEDYNNDGTKDILIQNTSSARSNLSYHLYLVDTSKDKITKIKSFNDIANPNYVAKYNLIDNYVLSGKNWTSF